MKLDLLLPENEHEAFHNALRKFSSRCIRVHADRMDTPLPFAVSQVPWFSGGRFLNDSSIRPAAFLNYAIADYYIQDAASLLPLALLDVQPDDVVCDFCASPGGKASAIAERLSQDGFLLANESIRSRVDVLRYALARTGKPTYSVCSYDPDQLAGHAPQIFDAVLVDAPCSGQTLVGKNKRDDNAFSDHQIEHCVLRQKRILLSAIRTLKTGGRLVYSTCTFSAEENEAQIRWLLDEFPGAWEPMEPPQLEPWKSKLGPGCYRVWPHRDRCAGGFAAGLRLTKEIEIRTNSIEKKQSKRVNSRVEKQKTEEARQARGNEFLYALGSFREIDIQWRSGIAQGLTEGVSAGLARIPLIESQPVALLIETGNHFVPTQALAMLDDQFYTSAQKFSLSQEQSMAFMSGNSISRPDNQCDNPNGWSVATWNERALGWFKSAGNRWNNHLPAWARISIDGQL